MRPDDTRVLAFAAALVALLDAVRLEGRADQASDALVPLADAGVERRALRSLIRGGRVRATRIGRRVYVSRADLAALLVSPSAVRPVAEGPRTAADPAEAARAAYAAPLRVVRGGGR